MEFHNKVTQQAAWDELVHKLSSWKNLTFAYLKSIKDAEPYSDELFNAMKSTNYECHMVLNKILKWILTNALPDNGEIFELLSQEFIESLFPYQRLSESPDRQLVITPNVCRKERPQYGSAFLSIDLLRSDIKINYETKTNHRILLFENPNRDLPNYNVPIQSKQLNSSSCYSSTLLLSEDTDFGTFTSHNLTQCAVRNTLQYSDQDQQEYDNRCTHSFVTKHQQQFTSPTNNYHETQNININGSRSRSYNEQRCKSKSTDSFENRHKTHHGNRNRSRSRSCNEQRCKSKSTDSLKKKQESRDRTRKKSRSRSPKRKENVNKYKQESRDRMRRKSRSRSRNKSPRWKENVFKRNYHSSFPSKSDFELKRKERMKRYRQHRKIKEERNNVKKKMIESDSEIEKIQGNEQQALTPVEPHHQNPDKAAKHHPRTSVIVMRPPPPYFMPPRLRLRFPPRPLLRLPPPIMYRPRWMP
ncbi:pre-mRNA-splicing factor CWC22 homolog [Aphis gossypii]|uniref:Uncharacterized protein n=1 Tax=Aphis gossypii TaxID=80765 RepID=A0A9P0J8G8_APHGO|nr:pre-mRNA-splicing factor CWC22 homolog [Aphis gossypii]CAH1731957.1 unnamed protein product [Aphis gossypii]